MGFTYVVALVKKVGYEALSPMIEPSDDLQIIELIGYHEKRAVALHLAKRLNEISEMEENDWSPYHTIIQLSPISDEIRI